MRVHWFNPENDLALACGAERYTPPQAPRRLREAGEALPLWYADSGDRVLCHGINQRWYEQMRQTFGLETDVYDHRPVAGMQACPWGWSAWARRTLLDEGLPEDCLPSPGQIQTMRELSHRRTAGKVLQYISERYGDKSPFMQPALEICDLDTYLKHQQDGLVLKSPWSSSGRGVIDTSACSLKKAEAMAADSIRRQGSVMVEISHSRLCDFAFIYRCQGGRCSFVATSVFTTDGHGAYQGNLLADEATRHATLTRWKDDACLTNAREYLRQAIEAIVAPHYDGIVGADLMVIEPESLGLALAEINLRTTMGYVAARFANRYLHPDSVGQYRVVAGPAPADLPPPVVDDRRLVEGSLPLTPPNPYFAFVATAERKK